MTTTPTEPARVLYYVASDREIYWTVTLPNSEAEHYCANRYATFFGHDIGQRQVYGWASSPLGAAKRGSAALRSYFLRKVRPMIDREYYPDTRISVRAAPSFDALCAAA